MGGDEVRTVEVVATLSLATDLATGVPLEHGLHGALIARRLADCLGTDAQTAAEAFYISLLFSVGCTGVALTAARVFGDDNALTTYAAPVRFDSPRRRAAGLARAVAPPGEPAWVRAARLARGVPRLVRAFPDVSATDCDVAHMLFGRLGLSADLASLFEHIDDRWDGKGLPRGPRGESVPLSMRIAHVARDAAFQNMLGGEDFAVRMVRSRAGGAFDPNVAECFSSRSREILDRDPRDSAWPEILDAEPAPQRVLDGGAIDDALGAMGDFADLVSPFLLGHSAGVAGLAINAARLSGLDESETRTLHRAALVHDLGRVTVSARVWEVSGRLSPDDWEQVRLHPYHTERILSRSVFLSSLAPTAALHHERLDGSGYHRGCPASAISFPARVLAAADRYHALTEPRAHRAACSQVQAAERLAAQASCGRHDADAVAAVLTVAGQSVPRIERPAGLTARERQVVTLLARGLQTKQVARVLGVSIKTADTHIQHAYRKIGVSTRAGAALFAVQHGLTTQENSR
jgi:HD-GYP domain-containing protein (c-di-GMP phosphodiesterase class II)